MLHLGGHPDRCASPIGFRAADHVPNVAERTERYSLCVPVRPIFHPFRLGHSEQHTKAPLLCCEPRMTSFHPLHLRLPGHTPRLHHPRVDGTSPSDCLPSLSSDDRVRVAKRWDATVELLGLFQPRCPLQGPSKQGSCGASTVTRPLLACAAVPRSLLGAGTDEKHSSGNAPIGVYKSTTLA